MDGITLLDCTLRDGGYYNNWDFSTDVMNAYLSAMAALPVDVVEVGFRAFSVVGRKFAGACGYCTEEFISALEIPSGPMRIAVMVNATDLTGHSEGPQQGVSELFGPASDSRVDIVRIAAHVNKVADVLPATERLHELGYTVTIQLMQMAGLSSEEIVALGALCAKYPIDVLYFADSLGGMAGDDVEVAVASLREHWTGQLGFHAHNNMEKALENTLKALEHGVSWVDATVLGMGRGPGNTHTDSLAMELEWRAGRTANVASLLEVQELHFGPLQQLYGWGPNAYYYMAGKYGIHPTYVQNMLNDSRYSSADVLASVQHLRNVDARHYNPDTLEGTRSFYSAEPIGTWRPAEVLEGREVLVLGSGPGVARHREAIERYVRAKRPFVLALNTQSEIDSNLIDAHIACHPFRLLANCREHSRSKLPLIAPASDLPSDVRDALSGANILDYGLGIRVGSYDFGELSCILPSPLVLAYSLAVATSGRATRILLAGFDGYGPGDPRNDEAQSLLDLYMDDADRLETVSVTPTAYRIPIRSIYSM